MEKIRHLRRRLSAAAVFAVLAVMVAACGAAKPLDYTAIDEIPPGPGLFSGKDGKLTVFRK
ncbi:MAG: hypothetical protein O2967_13195 [Proteobacteria bacterium]|nr:hypothetical protein [Pseudomonadota bacterium]